MNPLQTCTGNSCADNSTEICTATGTTVAKAASRFISLQRIARLSFAFATAILLAATPATAQNFGSAVAVSGNQVLIGDGANPAFPGKVYVFEAGSESAASNMATTPWNEVARLSATDSVDRFGSSVAATDNMMVVGAPGAESVFIYERNASAAWSNTATIAGSGKSFGSAVATDDSIILVASSGTDDTPGSVSAYRKVGNGWQLDGTLTTTDGATGDGFGSAIAFNNGTAFVTAPSTAENAGAVYVFTRTTNANGTSSWSEPATLSNRLAESGFQFGSSIAFLNADGSRVAVGAPGFARRTGIVIIYSRDEDGAWSVDEQLLPFSSVRDELFGSAIGVSGNELWVGAPGYGGRFGTGAVYSFRLTNDMPADVGAAVAARYGRGGTDSSTDGLGRTTNASILPVVDLPDGARLGSSIAGNSKIGVLGAPGFDNRAGAGIGFVRSVADGRASWAQGSALINEIESYPSMTGGMIECKDDVAAAFPCDGVDMSAFLSLKDLGADRGIRLNDLWGWEDQTTGKEYAIVGLSNQASFVDVTDAFNPVYLGKLPMPESANMSVWRDMKVYKDHVYIVADGAGDHGMQVFDLRQLRGITTPQVFEPTFHYRGIHSAHNVVINEETGFAYAVGSSSGGETCGGGLHMINIHEPANPVFAGCFSDGTTGRRGTGYSHDAQCVVYSGPDTDYTGKEICIGSNETALSIADVTDKENPRSVSIATYPNAQYTHQGWLTDDQRYFYLNDELDEAANLVDGTRTMIFDLADLDDPLLVGEHISTTTETDHNLYVKGNLMYQSNTGAGLRILDITDPEKPFETAFFDTSPVGGRGGTWSNYPYFKSGKIAVTGGHYGLFILRKAEVEF